MQCNIPGCDQWANTRFAKVPVCKMHKDELQDEALLFYTKGIDKRELFETIRQKTPWKNLEEGDRHQATVRKIRNGVATIYEIKGGRYVLDHADTYKPKGGKRK